ncbi:hypothetical protein F4775DRAFT_562643 [Biscogniauxia sp. FL1348]|nr:hypothetical protein F4775DRAFT_562643 [Biscogniauxia sp. FL1348]
MFVLLARPRPKPRLHASPTYLPSRSLLELFLLLLLSQTYLLYLVFFRIGDHSVLSFQTYLHYFFLFTSFALTYLTYLLYLSLYFFFTLLFPLPNNHHRHGL